MVQSRSIQLLHLDQARIPMYQRATHWVVMGTMDFEPALRPMLGVRLKLGEMDSENLLNRFNEIL